MKTGKYHVMYIDRAPLRDEDPAAGLGPNGERDTVTYLVPDAVAVGFGTATGYYPGNDGEGLEPAKVVIVESPQDFPIPTRWRLTGQIGTTRTDEERRAAVNEYYEIKKKTGKVPLIPRDVNVVTSNFDYVEIVNIEVEADTREELLEAAAKVPLFTDELAAQLMRASFYRTPWNGDNVRQKYANLHIRTEFKDL